LVAAILAPGPAHADTARIVAQDVPLRGARTLASVAPIEFDLVGLHWQGAGGVRFRTRSETGQWSAWRPAAPEAEDGPDPGTAEAARSRGWRIGNPYWTGPSDRIQYRVARGVRRLRAYFVHSPVEARPLRTVSLAGAPPIVPRAAWGANEQIRRAQPTYASSLRFAIVHHTAGTNSYSPAQSAAIVRGIELYHVKANGWNDIAYNFLVDKYGQVFEGRYGGTTRPVIGAHAEGFNTGSVGVALLGNYSTAAPTAAEIGALTKLLAWRLDVAHVDPLSQFTWGSLGNPKFPAGRHVTLRTISGHRDTGFTACPGNAAYRRIPSLAQAVASTGLPKLYFPTVRGSLGGSVRFAARLSAVLPWTVTVRDATGRAVAAGTGIGTEVSWTWDSSAVPRKRYAWSIEAPGVRPAHGSLGGTVTAPPAALLSDLLVSPALVTPNGDGVADFATVSYALRDPALVTATIADEQTTTVVTLFSEQKEAGRQSFRFLADGVPDGRYRITLTAQAADGTRATATATIVVSRVLQSFALDRALFSPNGDGVLDRVTFSFDLATPASVRLDVLRGARVVATPFAADADAGQRSVHWDGSVPTGRLADGRYDAVLEVRNSTATVSVSSSLVSDTTAPRLTLLSTRPLRVRISEPGVLTVYGRGRQLTLRVRAGVFLLPATARASRAFVRDEAGNRSKVLRIP
jgi:hypothetical protein